MGPDGGVKGGNIIAEGKPEEIINVKDSYTGKFLKPMLDLPLVSPLLPPKESNWPKIDLGPDFDQFSEKSIYHAGRNMGMKPSKF